MIKNTICCWIILLLLLITSGTTLSKTNPKNWRCGRNVITIGDSKESILLKCGPPTSGDSTGYTTEGALNAFKNGNMTEEEFKARMQVSEEWVYNCGSGKFNTVLSFQDGVLVSITRDQYGSGESFCEGAKRNPNNKEKINQKSESDENEEIDNSEEYKTMLLK